MNPAILEWSAVVVSVLGIWLMTQRRMLAWPVGLVSVGLYALVFFEAKLYSDTLLQLAFAAFLLYGWINWHRQDKPDGIAWIIRNHPEVSDGQISKLIGTTRTTIAAIRDRTHWNIANIVPKDPVTLGLCSQRELDAIVAKAAKKAGIKAPEDSRFEGDREALLEELRAERSAAAEARAAEDHSDDEA